MFFDDSYNWESVEDVKAHLIEKGAKVVVTNDEIQSPLVDTRKMTFAAGYCFGAIHVETGLELTDFAGFNIKGQRIRFYWNR